MQFPIGSRSYTVTPDFFENPTPHYPFFAPLDYLGIIKVIGPQALSFLQGQLTNDVNLATENQIQKQLLCNIKGQLISKLFLIKQEENFILICPQDLIPQVLNLLSKTAALSRVSLEADLSSPIYGIFSHENMPYYPLESAFYFSFTPPDLIQKPEIFWHYQQLIANQFSIYPDTCKLFLPHHLGLETSGWISFNKGCYRGQEIIARMHYRGKSKYHIEQWIEKFDPELQPGATLSLAKNEKQGEIIDICPINNEDVLILACLKIS